MNIRVYRQNQEQGKQYECVFTGRVVAEDIEDVYVNYFPHWSKPSFIAQGDIVEVVSEVPSYCGSISVCNYGDEAASYYTDEKEFSYRVFAEMEEWVAYDCITMPKPRVKKFEPPVPTIETGYYYIDLQDGNFRAGKVVFDGTDCRYTGTIQREMDTITAKRLREEWKKWESLSKKSAELAEKFSSRLKQDVFRPEEDVGHRDRIYYEKGLQTLLDVQQTMLERVSLQESIIAEFEQQHEVVNQMPSQAARTMVAGAELQCPIGVGGTQNTKKNVNIND